MTAYKILICIFVLLLALTACEQAQNSLPTETQSAILPIEPQATTPTDLKPQLNGVEITLTDSQIQVDGVPVATDSASAVYIANDIIYYEAGKDFTYGEGTETDAHSAELAQAHTVLHITKPGTYRISGKLSKGQIAVDLGKDAKSNPDAIVTLILNGVDITCEVAPAVIFYNVYECGDTETGTKDVDTTAAGANVILADGSENHIHGSYVARIYKPESIVLNDTGTEVTDAKKLHKYDGAFYSKMSMNISGEATGSGILNIYAENEGLDSELHLTVNGGNINIYSGNDGINTNEDGISVTTINGGALTIRVTGETGEGDGIDSNGWLVINGGTVFAAACSHSADAGIDSDMGIHINGGTVIASGHMLDRIEDNGQTYAVFSFNQQQNGTDTLFLKDENANTLLKVTPQNAYSILIYSSPDLKEGIYTLWSNEEQLAYGAGSMNGRPGMMPPDGFDKPMERPEGNPHFEGMTPPDGSSPIEGQRPPEGEFPPDKPSRPNDGNWNSEGNPPQERTPDFQISQGANQFSGIAPLE